LYLLQVSTSIKINNKQNIFVKVKTQTNRKWIEHNKNTFSWTMNDDDTATFLYATPSTWLVKFISLSKVRGLAWRQAPKIVSFFSSDFFRRKFALSKARRAKGRIKQLKLTHSRRGENRPAFSIWFWRSAKPKSAAEDPTSLFEQRWSRIDLKI
jgi:hypothetical protein